MNKQLQRVWINTGSKDECNAAISEMLIFGPSAKEFLYIGSLALLPEDWSAAKPIGEGRRRLHDRKRNRKTGEVRNFDNETDAVLAEILVADLIQHRADEIAPYVAHRACRGYDAILDGISLDVKAIRMLSRSVSINRDSHHRSTSDFYVICRIADVNTLDIFAISHSAVETWRLEKPLDEHGNECPRKWYYSAPLPPRLELSSAEKSRVIGDAFAALSAR